MSDSKPLTFNAFDRKAEIAINTRNLPHWFQAGVSIFVTFRTADSMPQEVLLRWERELEEWLSIRGVSVGPVRSLSSPNDALFEQALLRLTAVQQLEFKRLSDRVFHQSLDACHGECLLRRLEFATIVGKALLFHDAEKYDLDSFVVMPNHAHVIVQFRANASLQIVSESWMRYTARSINKLIGRTGAFWQPEPFDHLIRSPEQFTYLQRYIAENPKKSNLRQGEYLYWNREKTASW